MMNREKTAWMVSVLLIALLAFHLPGSMAQRESDYGFVRRLVDIHRQIANNYVENIDDQKLEQGALEGMFAQLDPFSMYVPPARQQEFDRMLDGSFEGVGIQLNQDEKTREIEVITPIEGSPAFKAGVYAGDIILKVNGESIAGQSILDVTKKIKGKVNTPVTLRVRHTTGEEADLTMNREEIEDRLHPHHPVHPRHRRARQRSALWKRRMERNARRRHEGTDPRPALQSRRAARPGGQAGGPVH